MSSRAVSAAVVAAEVSPDGRQHQDNEADHHEYQHRRQEARIDYDSSNSESDTSSHVKVLTSPSQSIHLLDNRRAPIASKSPSSSRIMVPESAPAASTSFLRERSTYDSSPSEDDDDQDALFPDAGSHSVDRFSSPALARRRYPSTSNTTTAALPTTAATTTSATRRMSSKSRRPSSAAMFDVKGKGPARRDYSATAGGGGGGNFEHYSDDDHEDDADDGQQQHGIGYARVRSDLDRIPQAPRTAPLSHAQGTRRSVSHSHPSRRYTTGFDPFMRTTSNTPPNGDYPEIARVKKKRSYTYSGAANGSGRSREVSGSSSPDRSKVLTPSSQQDFQRRKAHLPRSASDFVTASITGTSNVRLDRPSNGRRATSGSSSPLHPRSHSSGNIPAGDTERTGRPNGLSNNTYPSSTILQHKLSGLQMRNNSRTNARNSPVRATFSSNIPPQRDNSPSSALAPNLPARKRAKSALYPPGGSSRSSSADVAGAARPVRSFSSQHIQRHNGPQSLPTEVYAQEGRYARFPTAEADETVNGRRVHHAEETRDIPPHSPTIQNTPSSSGLAGKSILKSGSHPVSMASLVSEQVGGATVVPPSDTGPSLQDLLSQVDLQSALTLVRAANNHNTPLLTERKPITTDFSFQPSSNGIRASIDAPSSRRSGSPVKSVDQSVLSSRSSAASPTTIGSRATRTPLLTHNEFKKSESDRISVDSPLQTSASVRIALDNGTSPDKKRKRLSMKRLFGVVHNRHESGSSGLQTAPHSRTTSHDSQIISEGAFATVGVSHAPESDHHQDISEMLEDIRARVDPTMKKYAASVKSELEIRYLPVYTALAMGQTPPNPLAVARQLQQENTLRRSQSINSLSPHSPARRYVDEAQSSGRTGKSAQQPPSLADRIRKKGHRRSVWEVYPRDIAAYSMSLNSRADTHDPYTGHRRSDVLEALSRGRQPGHRHASSEISLGSLASIREDRPMDAFRQDGRSRHGFSNSMSNRNGGGGAAGRYMLPLSPTRSRSGQSDVSSYIASDEAMTAGLERSISDTGPGWTSEGHIQSSPEHNKWQTTLPQVHKHQSSRSWSSRGFRMLRPESIASSGLAQSDRSSRENFMALSNGDARKTHQGGAGNDHAHEEGRVTPLGNSTKHRTSASDVELRLKKSTSLTVSTPAGSNSRPPMSRSTSKASSLSGLGKILGGKRSFRMRDDGYRSTDNEDLPRGQVPDSKSKLYKSTINPQSGRTSLQSFTEKEMDPTATDNETTASIFGEHTLQVQEVDVDNEEMERAEGFLHDLKASLSKAEALERRAPPKMQTYLQKYMDYDAQRMQKGQLATINLGIPPQLCRHFFPADVDFVPKATQSGTTTPGQVRSEGLEDGRSPDTGTAVNRPPCYRKQSDSSLAEDEKRVPLLEKVTTELDDASKTLDDAVSKSRDVMQQQDTAKDKINDIVELANTVENLIGGEVFQQLRMLEDHLMRLRYNATDTRGYADAAWAVLSYILRIFFWFSWIGVTLLRLVKATLMLPFTVVVTILRWLFL